MVAQLWIHSTPLNLCTQGVNFMICELYFNKTVTEKLKTLDGSPLPKQCCGTCKFLQTHHLFPAELSTLILCHFPLVSPSARTLNTPRMPLLMLTSLSGCRRSSFVSVELRYPSGPNAVSSQKAPLAHPSKADRPSVLWTCCEHWLTPLPLLTDSKFLEFTRQYHLQPQDLTLLSTQ